jgi:hypothetical protein
MAAQQALAQVPSLLALLVQSTNTDAEGAVRDRGAEDGGHSSHYTACH